MSLKALQVKTSGTYLDVQVSKDGALLTQDWVQAQVIKGNVFNAFFGDATTPATLDAAWANTDPDISIDVPDGRLIIPLRITVVIEAYGTTALFETMCLCSRTLGGASATAFVPINMRTRTGGGSNCTVCTAPTVTSGYTTGSFELFRNTQTKAVTLSTADDDSHFEQNVTEWNYLANGPAPVLEGNASLQVWATCQAATGYINIYWLELSENDI